MNDMNDIVVCLADYKINGISTYLKIGIVTEVNFVDKGHTYIDDVKFDSFETKLPERFLRKIAEIWQS